MRAENEPSEKVRLQTLAARIRWAQWLARKWSR